MDHKKKSKTKTTASEAALKLSTLHQQQQQQQQQQLLQEKQQKQASDISNLEELIRLPESYKGTDTNNILHDDSHNDLHSRADTSNNDSEYFLNSYNGNDDLLLGNTSTVNRTRDDSGTGDVAHYDGPMAYCSMLFRLLRTNIYTTKFMLNVIAIGSMIGLSYGLYHVMTSLEQSNFQQQFSTMSYAISDHVVNQFITSMESLYDLSYQYEILASSAEEATPNATTTPFPYVTLDSFGPLTATTLQRTKGTMISQHPTVSTNQRVSWEDYVTVQHSDWM
jgi:hypothetical protein